MAPIDRAAAVRTCSAIQRRTPCRRKLRRTLDSPRRAASLDAAPAPSSPPPSLDSSKPAKNTLVPTPSDGATVATQPPPRSLICIDVALHPRGFNEGVVQETPATARSIAPPTKWAEVRRTDYLASVSPRQIAWNSGSFRKGAKSVSVAIISRISGFNVSARERCCNAFSFCPARLQ